MTWTLRNCDGCGALVAARSADPTVQVLCEQCHPGDLPEYPPGEEPDDCASR